MNADPPSSRGNGPEAVAWEMVQRGESSVAVRDAAGVASSGSSRIDGTTRRRTPEDVRSAATGSTSERAGWRKRWRRLWHRLPGCSWPRRRLASAVIIGAFERQLEDRVCSPSSSRASCTWRPRSARRPRRSDPRLRRGRDHGADPPARARQRRGSQPRRVRRLPARRADRRGEAHALGVTLACSRAAASTSSGRDPFGLHRPGKDPFGSGPLATVLQDLLTIGSTSELPSGGHLSGCSRLVYEIGAAATKLLRYRASSSQHLAGCRVPRPRLGGGGATKAK